MFPLFRKQTPAAVKENAAATGAPADVVVRIDGIELDDTALENVAGGRADWAEDYLAMRYRVDTITF